jgi:ferredoxin
MDKKFTIIGSGATGVNAALTLLEKGYNVEMLDYGLCENQPAQKSYSFKKIKDQNPNAINFFYGTGMGGISDADDLDVFKYPERRKSISTINLYDNPENTESFQPFFSHTKGGLAEAWGANSIEFNQEDMIGFGYKKKEIEKYYKTAYQRLHVSGPIEDDDISDIANATYKFNSSHDMSASDKVFLKISDYRKKLLKTNPNVLIGQSRLAIDSRITSDNKCVNCGLCIWGCPSKSIYSPLSTIEECLKYDNFKYKNNIKISHFISFQGTITHLVDTENNKHKVHNVILSAGAINSAIILLKSLKENSIVNSNKLRSVGLLDTTVIKIPYLLLPNIFTKFTTDKIQFNGLLAMVKNYNKKFPKWTQVELLSLGPLIYHPLLKKIPLGIKNSIFAFNLIKNMMGVATIFLPDRHQDSNFIEVDFSKAELKVTYQYSESIEKINLKKDIINKLKWYMRSVGSIMLNKQAIEPKFGSGIHYAGTIPYRDTKTVGCVNSFCKSYDFSNLHIVDGSVLPSLPSKSITLNTVANAIRVADSL